MNSIDLDLVHLVSKDVTRVHPGVRFCNNPARAVAGQTLLFHLGERRIARKAVLVAHLTEALSLEDESEIDLHRILKRSIPVLLTRLVAELRKLDTAQEATYWLDRTNDLIERGKNIKTPEEKLADQAQDQ